MAKGGMNTVAKKGGKGGRRPGGVRHVSEVVAEILARTGLGGSQSAREVQAAWAEIVGPPLDGLSRVSRLFRGKLEVVVAHSAALQELTFRKRHILQELQKRWPDQRIRDLKFRVGQVS